MAQLSVQSLLESFSSSVSSEWKETALPTLASRSPGCKPQLIPTYLQRLLNVTAQQHQHWQQAALTNPNPFPRQHAQSQCFLPTRPWAILLHSLYLLTKLTFILGQTLQYGAKWPVWGCSWCNPSLSVSSHSEPHATIFPRTILCWDPTDQATHTPRLQIPVIRRATLHFLNTVHITNTARRKGKQEFQLQAIDRKEKKILPFFFPWSKIQIQMPFSTRVLRH